MAMEKRVTIEDVRRDLPEVDVRIGKRKMRGRVYGRKNPFATVVVETPYGTIGAEFAWGVIADCMSNGRALIVDGR